MTSVYFSLSPSEDVRPGLAIGEVWQAFVRGRFIKRKFTIAVGIVPPTPSVDLEPGEYWVQVKFSDGRLLKELVTVPADARANLVLGSGTEESFTPLSSARTPTTFFTSEEFADEDVGQVVAIPWLQSPPAVPASPPSARGRKRSFDSASILPPTYQTPTSSRSPFIRMSRVATDSVGLPGSAAMNSLLTTSIRLNRLHGRFDTWSKSPRSVGFSSASERKPEDYFRHFLQTEYRVPADAITGGDRLFIDLENVTFPIETATSLISDSHAVYRDFVVLEEQNGGSYTLVSIPRNLREDPARVTVTDDDPGPAFSLKVSLEFNDPLSNSLLQFLRNGDVSSAMTMIESSQSILYAKFDHPVAAAAAAYVLIHAAPDTLKTPWQEWIGNLGHFFKEIPDAQILHATLLLQRGDPARWENNAGPKFENYFPTSEAGRTRLAAELILASVEKGPPIFRMGLSLMASNLRILKHAELAEEQKQSLARVESLVTWLSMRVDPIEPFSIFRLER